MIVVDSSGWLEYFADASNSARFAPAIEKPESLIVPSVTLLEVLKRVTQQRDRAKALICIAAMQRSPVVNLDSALALTAAMLGLLHKLPLADSIIYATAQAAGATLWTQDADFEGLPGVKYFAKTA